MATLSAVLFAGANRLRGTDDRGQTTGPFGSAQGPDDGGQTTGDRRQRTDDGGQTTDNGRLPTATAARDFSPVTRHL